MRNLALGLLLSLASAGAAAQAFGSTPMKGFFAGAGIGDSEPFAYYGDYWYSDTESGDSGTSVSVFGGYRFNRYLAVEAAYLDASDLGWDGDLLYVPDLLDIYNVDVNLDVTATELSVVGILPFAGIWEVYLRGGLAFWQADGSQHLTPSFGGIPVDRTLDDSGTGFLFGIGGGVTFLQNLHARLEYQVFDIDEDLFAADDLDATIDTLSLDIQYRFGSQWRQ